MGCLFSKKAVSSEEDLIQRDDSGDASDVGAGGSAPTSSAAGEHHSVAGSTAIDSAASVGLSMPDVLKPMGRGGFADITTGIQEQLGRYGNIRIASGSFCMLILAAASPVQLEGTPESVRHRRGGAAIRYER
jgi:hypothetical protein